MVMLMRGRGFGHINRCLMVMRGVAVAMLMRGRGLSPDSPVGLDGGGRVSVQQQPQLLQPDEYS